MHTIRLRREYGFNVMYEGVILSMIKAKYRDQWSVLGLGLGVRKGLPGYEIVKRYGVDWDTVRFASYTDVRANARLIFIIVVWHR
ncbi:Nicotinate-Nucleotide Pyrophosphorylase [Carboxylating] [Manis pentadactyla]|nr:Nicotinate-Nucleotide Pyrophosphorylase [Carboxylating] [Manis pentadactyla]